MALIEQISDKYLLSSMLQKSIRLGNTLVANQVVEQLFKTDKSYLMYRMMIVAFEDVGAANLELMKHITQYRWGVRNFKERQINFLDYFKQLSTQLCESPKDRTACDSVYLIKLALSRGDLRTINDNSMLSQIYEGWCRLGFKRYPLNESPSAIEALDDLESYIAHAGPDSHYLTQFYSTQVEPFFISVPYLYAEIQAQVKKDTTPQSVLLNPPSHINTPNSLSLDSEMCWSAIDGHTRLGSQCLSEFLRANAKELHHIAQLDSDRLYKAAKSCLFRVEGQIISPPLAYPSAQRIKQLIQQKEQAYFFPDLNWAQYVELGKFIKKRLPELNAIRQKNLPSVLTPLMNASSVSATTKKL